MLNLISASHILKTTLFIQSGFFIFTPTKFIFNEFQSKQVNAIILNTNCYIILFM